MTVGTGARAQTTGQIVPPAFQPPTATVSVGPLPADPPPVPSPGRAPEGAERLTFRAGPVRAKGGLAPLPGETAAIPKPLESRTLSVSALFEAAAAPEVAYARAGLVPVRVAVPPTPPSASIRGRTSVSRAPPIPSP